MLGGGSRYRPRYRRRGSTGLDTFPLYDGPMVTYAVQRLEVNDDARRRGISR